MLQGWEALTFLHWRVDPAVMARRLPADLQVETCDGSAWVGLVPFIMTVTLPGVPPVPCLSRFCETNVRTYVRDRHGRSGVWFFSLDAARLGAVLGGPHYLRDALPVVADAGDGHRCDRAVRVSAALARPARGVQRGDR